jgi:5-methyltetrahydropteroyltriglutamate--homocysteine methyltransferase
VKRSIDRILTTHSGSLIRTQAIVEGIRAQTLNLSYDEQILANHIREGIREVVRKQVDSGIDIPNDGEYARRVFHGYIHSRLSGLEPRTPDPEEVLLGQQVERAQFPEFYELYRRSRYQWMYPDISMQELANVPANLADRFRLVGPVRYTGQASVQADIANLNSALQGFDVADAFITAVTPVSRKGDRNIEEVYSSEAEYLYAVADAMHEEYKAITDAGFILQLDYAVLNPHEQLLKEKRKLTPNELRNARELGVEITNHALRGIPEERVRYHHCWGSSNRPHTEDAPLTAFVDQLLKLNVQAYGIEAANPRHEHEWMMWKDVKLPDGKILIPGLISQSTNVVEHPELVASRIKNFASVVGKENVIAGCDCGFSQSWDWLRLHPSIQWAKLRALADGAALASKDLW